MEVIVRGEVAFRSNLVASRLALVECNWSILPWRLSHRIRFSDNNLECMDMFDEQFHFIPRQGLPLVLSHKMLSEIAPQRSCTIGVLSPLCFRYGVTHHRFLDFVTACVVWRTWGWFTFKNKSYNEQNVLQRIFFLALLCRGANRRLFLTPFFFHAAIGRGTSRINDNH